MLNTEYKFNKYGWGSENNLYSASTRLVCCGRSDVTCDYRMNLCVVKYRFGLWGESTHLANMRIGNEVGWQIYVQSLLRFVAVVLCINLF